MAKRTNSIEACQGALAAMRPGEESERVSHHHHHHSKRPPHRKPTGDGRRLESRVRGSASEIASYLSACADALRGGGVQIRAGDHAVGLLLDDRVTLDLRAEADDGHMNQITLVISWRPPLVATPAPQLQITALAPAGEPDHPTPTPSAEDEIATPDAETDADLPSVAPVGGAGDRSKRGQRRPQER